MTNFLFPSVSNKKGEGKVSLEDFKSVTPKKERKGDLSFRSDIRRFTIAPSVVEGRNEFTGFVPVVSEDGVTPYLLKSTDEKSFGLTTSVRGQSASRTFTSETLEFVVTNGGLSLEKPLYLSKVDDKDGFEVYSISNEPSTTVQPAKTTEDAPEVEPTASTDTVGQAEATPVSVPNAEAQYAATQAPAVDETITSDNSSLTDLI